MTMAKANTILPADFQGFTKELIQAGMEILNNTFCAEIHLRSLSFRRKINSEDILNEKERQKEEQVQASSILASKSLIEKTLLQSIAKADGQFRRMVMSLAVPSSVVTDGMYLMPRELAPRLETEIAAFIERRAEMVEAFIAEYPTLKALARARLGRLYSEGDYPSIDEIRAAFVVEFRYVTLSAPEQLAILSKEIFEREKRKMERQWAEAFGEIREAMRGSFLDLVGHMVDRLTPDADGKPKIFRDSLVENLADFLGTFNARNLTKDDDLQALVEKARGLLKGVRPDSIRKRTNLRSQLASSFNEIKSALDGMVMTPSRVFKFGQGV